VFKFNIDSQKNKNEFKPFVTVIHILSHQVINTLFVIKEISVITGTFPPSFSLARVLSSNHIMYMNESWN